MSLCASFRVVAVMLVTAALTVACSSSGDEQGAAPAPKTEGVAIAHKYGSTTITGTPKRVVTVGLIDHDSVLALGVKPVGVTDWFGEHPYATWPWAQDALGDAQPAIVGNTQGINFEAVADAEPDVIIALYAGLTKKDYDTLKAIAPTVAQPKEHVDFGIPWDELTLTVGKVLGREERAQGIVDGIEQKFAAVRAEHPDFEGATAMVATPYQGTVSVYAPEDARGRFLSALGFEQPPEIAKLAGDGFSADLSLERLDLLDADALIWILGDVERDRATMEKEALYRRLPVHTAGREVFVANLSELGGATSFVTVLSLPLLLDELVPQIASAMDGVPAAPE